MLRDKVGAGLAKGYVFTLRCTPPIVLLFLVFYGLPQFWTGGWALTLTTGPSLSLSLVAMFLLFAAMISEVFKAAYLAIPKGQMEAAWVLAWRRLKPFGGLSFLKPFAWLFQIWQLPSWTSCAMPLWLIPLALSISWEQATTWSAAILGIIPSKHIQLSQWSTGQLPLWSPSPLNSLRNDSV